MFVNLSNFFRRFLNPRCFASRLQQQVRGIFRSLDPINQPVRVNSMLLEHLLCTDNSLVSQVGCYGKTIQKR